MEDQLFLLFLGFQAHWDLHSLQACLVSPKRQIRHLGRTIVGDVRHRRDYQSRQTSSILVVPYSKASITDNSKCVSTKSHLNSLYLNYLIKYTDPSMYSPGSFHSRNSKRLLVTSQRYFRLIEGSVPFGLYDIRYQRNVRYIWACARPRTITVSIT